jgi:predicted nucleic acid-binding protein
MAAQKQKLHARMKETVHFDSSILIPYVAGLMGTRERRQAPNNKRAVEYTEKTLANSRIRICAAAFAETLREFESREDVAAFLLETFKAPIPMGAAHARRWGRMQNRSSRTMGDNDAWIAAVAIGETARLVGNDEKACSNRPGLSYTDFLA